MSTIITNEPPRTFLISLAMRLTGSVGFARSLLAICAMWLLPELKPTMHYNHRKSASHRNRRTKRRSTPTTTPSSSPSITLPPTPVQASPLQRPSLKHSKRSSFAVVFSNITRSSPRKWSASSTSTSTSTSAPSSDSPLPPSSSSDSDRDLHSSPSTFCRPRLSFPTRLPNMKQALSITQGRKSFRRCDPITRSKTTDEMCLSPEPTKSLKEKVVFTHPWMSRSRTSTTPSDLIIPKPSRFPFKRNLSHSRPSPLASPCATPSPSYFSRIHPRKESYSLYLRGLPRFEGGGCDDVRPNVKA